MGYSDRIKVIQCDYDSEAFYEAVRGMENLPEGGERCMECFRLRLGKCAEYASENGYDYFTTTLSISPHKNAQMLNEAGKGAEEKYGVKYLYSDFKKKNGYKRSCELSEMYGLYRQDYCGCIYSKIQSETR
jgi:predicted adenine nucleotide alpha hydrolase (AANH) superfamily ATPase